MKLAGWVLASGIFHGALIAAVMTGVVSPRWEAVEPEPIEIEIVGEQMEPSLPEPRPPDVSPPDPPPLPDLPPPDPSSAPEMASARLPDPMPDPAGEVAPAVAAVAPGPIVNVPEVGSARPPGEVDERERQRLNALINPSSVARSGFDFGPGPSQRGRAAGLAPLYPGARSEEEIEESLSSGLRAEAMTKQHLEREPFELQRRADGTQVWAGPRLTGIINPDGSVDFEDRPNVQTNGFSASGTFDMTEAFMGASGQDPLRAERDYFMRQTEELRARLEAEHRRRTMSAGLSRLPGRLDGIWAAEQRSRAARRARIFSIWDGAADDDDGREAREIVLRWIRERLPFGSADAYTEAELRRFNAARESSEEFDPY